MKAPLLKSLIDRADRQHAVAALDEGADVLVEERAFIHADMVAGAARR